MCLAESPVIILSGPGQSGKTTLLSALVCLLREEGVKVAGILAEGLWENGVRSGFNLIDLFDDSSVSLSRRIPDNDLCNGIPFEFYEAGLAAGMRALSLERCAGADVVIVDEVGLFSNFGEKAGHQLCKPCWNLTVWSTSGRCGANSLILCALSGGLKPRGSYQLKNPTPLTV